MSTTTIPSSMLNFYCKLNRLDASGNVLTGADNEVILDCSAKNLFGYAAPDIEEVAVDNPEYAFKMRFFGKSGFSPATLTCVYEATKRELLEKWKQVVPPQRFQVSFTCEEIAKVQTTKPVVIGQLGEVTGTNAPSYQMTLEPLGGKTHSPDGEVLVDSPLPQWSSITSPEQTTT